MNILKNALDWRNMLSNNMTNSEFIGKQPGFNGYFNDAKFNLEGIFMACQLILQLFYNCLNTFIILISDDYNLIYIIVTIEEIL